MVAFAVLSRTAAFQPTQTLSGWDLISIILPVAQVSVMAVTGTANFIPSRQKHNQRVMHLYP